METERQKFFKHKIKRISISNKDDTSNSSVTILSSASYNEQVNDLRILNPNSNDADPETTLQDIDLNYESNLDKNTLDMEAKTLNENIMGLEHHDFTINNVTIEVEREFQEEIEKPEVTEIERTIS